MGTTVRRTMLIVLMRNWFLQKRIFRLHKFIPLLTAPFYFATSVKDKRLHPALIPLLFLVLPKTLPKCRYRPLLMKQTLAMWPKDNVLYFPWMLFLLIRLQGLLMI